MNNQNQNITNYYAITVLRRMLIFVGIVLFFVVGTQMINQANSRQVVVGQSVQSSK